MNINAQTKLYCIFGSPVAHSLSPAMQNAAFASMGLNAVYLAFEPSGPADAVAAMKSLPIHGASVTIPFKTGLLRHLDAVDPLARKIGAINTLHNMNGTITGYTTDGYGAMRALQRGGASVKGSRTLIIGNGGSARAIAFTMLQEGARVVIAGRNPERITALASDLRTHHNGVDHILLEAVDSKFTRRIDIIINATPVGMEPRSEELPISPDVLHPEHAVMDIVYAPILTRLLMEAGARGCRTISGIDMLLYQGTRQFEIWTGLEAPEAVMMAALNRE
jgi:shikimate dehydrogenase